MILKVFDRVVVLVLDAQERIELSLEPLELFLQLNDAHVLGQFCVLFFAFHFEELELFLDLDHMHLVSVEEVIFVLAKYADQLGVVGVQRSVDLIKVVSHVLDIFLDPVHDWVKFIISCCLRPLEIVDEFVEDYETKVVSYHFSATVSTYIR